MLSPLAGLRRRSLGELEVTAQSIGTVAPAAAMSSVPALVAAEAGGATMASLVIATISVLLVGYCVTEFTRRMAASGSLYSFIARGLGRGPAMLGGAALIVGYVFLAMATLLLASVYLLSLLSGFGGPAAVIAVMAALALTAAVVMARGVSLASRVTLTVEVAAIASILVVLGILAAHGPHHAAGGGSGPPGSGGVLGGMSLQGPSVHGFGTGVALAITAFIGFESAAALGPEARRPHRTVGRAIGKTIAVSAVLYLVACWIELALYPGGSGGLAASSTPLPDLARGQLGGWLSGVLDIAIAASAFACASASTTALTRLLLSLAREGLLPRQLGWTSRRFQIPHWAIALSWPLIVAGPVGLLLGGVGAARAFPILLTIASLGYIVAYLLVCAALPRFLRRIGELTRGGFAAGVGATALLTGVLATLAVPARGSDRGVLLAGGALLLLGAVLLLVRHARRPAVHPPIGLYDEPIASDLLDHSILFERTAAFGAAERRAS
jgi:amino acid transporter